MRKRIVKIIFYAVLLFIFCDIAISSTELSAKIFTSALALYFLYKIFSVLRIPTEKITILAEDTIQFKNHTYGPDYYFKYYEMRRTVNGIPIQENYHLTILKKDTDEFVLKINCLLYTKAERNNLIRVAKHAEKNQSI